MPENKYFIGGDQAPTLTFYRGMTHIFDQSDPSNETHQMHLSETDDGIHAGGSKYTDGVLDKGTPGTDGSFVFKVPQNAPDTLYYVCTNHSGMGVGGSISVEQPTFSMLGSDLQFSYEMTVKDISESENKEAGIRKPQPWPGTGKDTDRNGLTSTVGQPSPASTRSSVLKKPKRRPRRRLGGVGGDSAGAIATTGGGTGMGTKSDSDWLNPKPITETGSFQDEVETRNRISHEIGKDEQMIEEGDFVMGETTEGLAHGVVEHIMWEGGVYGQPGTEYAIESLPNNPAMAVRVYEQDMNEDWVPTAYSIGMMYNDATVVDMEDHDMDEEDMEELEMMAKDSPCWDGYRQEGMKPGRNGGMVPNCVPVKKYHDALMNKAETYSPNDGMKSAARSAIKWKEDGKAKGAGTPVGWGRARDIVAGRSMSLSVVKRMFSFFSRHEVDKQGKGFNPGSEGYPSKGRVMWNAWGGDAGFAWSRAIVKRNEDKALFANFGKDYTKITQLGEIFKAESVRVGQMVSWNSSGGRATGKVKRIISSGSYNVPGTEFTINGTAENPAVVITLYRNGKPTDQTVAHRRSTLRAL